MSISFYSRVGGVKLDYTISLLQNLLGQIQSPAELNKMLESIGAEFLQDVKTFFYDKEYEKLGKTYAPLSKRWMDEKDQAYRTHLYINTQEFINSFYYEVKNKTLRVKITPDMEQRWKRLKKLRPVAQDKESVEYISQKSLNKILEQLKKTELFGHDLTDSALNNMNENLFADLLVKGIETI